MKRSRDYFFYENIFFRINLCKRIKRILREIDNNNNLFQVRWLIIQGYKIILDWIFKQIGIINSIN